MDNKPTPTRILVLCTHNSSRSQMTEGMLRQLGGDRLEVHSAGTEVTRVHPLAIEAMSRAGFSLEGHRSKHLSEFLDQKLDYVITVCGHAGESCPVFPGAPKRLHWGVADPSAVVGTEAEKLAAFEAARLELLRHIETFLASGIVG